MAPNLRRAPAPHPPSGPSPARTNAAGRLLRFRRYPVCFMRRSPHADPAAISPPQDRPSDSQWSCGADSRIRCMRDIAHCTARRANQRRHRADGRDSAGSARIPTRRVHLENRRLREWRAPRPGQRDPIPTTTRLDSRVLTAMRSVRSSISIPTAPWTEARAVGRRSPAARHREARRTRREVHRSSLAESPRGDRDVPRQAPRGPEAPGARLATMAPRAPWRAPGASPIPPLIGR